MSADKDTRARQWLYAIAWLAGGVAAYGLVIWLVTLIRYGWSAGTELVRIAAIANIAYGALGIMAMVTFGLTMRSAIRNIKASFGSDGANVEAKSSEGEDQ